MKKAEIEFHYDGCGYTPDRDYAAINVKVRAYWRDQALPMDLEGPTHPAFTHDWIEALPEREQTAAYDHAIELAWEHLQDDAENVYGPGAKVWSQGRSGGWAIIAPPSHPRKGFTHAEVDGWDAIALGKFRQWTKYAEGTRDDVMYLYFWELYYNVFVPRQEEARIELEARRQGIGTWADVV